MNSVIHHQVLGIWRKYKCKKFTAKILKEMVGQWNKSGMLSPIYHSIIPEVRKGLLLILSPLTDTDCGHTWYKQNQIDNKKYEELSSANCEFYDKSLPKAWGWWCVHVHMHAYVCVCAYVYVCMCYHERIKANKYKKFKFLCSLERMQSQSLIKTMY